MTEINARSCIALFSGGLDSVLAVQWMQNLGFTVYPVFFQAPYITKDRAVKTADDNGMKLIVRDITQDHLIMLQNPVYGYGKNFNPCIDCHALMFQMAGRMLNELDAAFIISGEVLGQRPMSQHRKALQDVQSLSEYGDLIIRPLCQQLLPDTKPIRVGWVDKSQLLSFNGRGRSRQIELAKQFGLSYPSPGGGCLLTDRNFTLRLRDLTQHDQASEENIRLLRWGRHFRLTDTIKLIIGRSETDNEGLENEKFPGMYFKIRDVAGPLGMLTTTKVSSDIIELAAAIVLAYASKAKSPDFVKYGVDNILIRDIKVEKCSEKVFRPFHISLD